MLSPFTLLCSQPPEPFSSCKINSLYISSKIPEVGHLMNGYRNALAIVAYLVGQYPPNLRVADLIPLRDTCLGYAFGFLHGGKEGYWSMFVTLIFLLSLSFSLKPLSLPSSRKAVGRQNVFGWRLKKHGYRNEINMTTVSVFIILSKMRGLEVA